MDTAADNFKLDFTMKKIVTLSEAMLRAKQQTTEKVGSVAKVKLVQPPL
jgi:hypothetical protein